MFSMDFKIQIGKFRLMLIDKVEITKSVEQLADTAVVTLPGTVFNRTLDIESKISEGDEITIEFGYNGDLKPEFAGYVESISTDDNTIKINCEDEIFKYRKSLKNTEFKNVSVKQILQHINKEIGGFDLNCDYDFQYEKFTIYNADAFDVLKKIQEETKSNVYLKGKTLHIHPQYSQIGNKVIYDFAVNIEKSDLKYKDVKKRKVLVEVEGKKVSGEVVKETVGVTGGDKINIKMDGVSDRATLKRIAENQLAIKSYTGYEGSITGWLIPYCEPTDKAEIRDKDYEIKNGDYYVVSVQTSFSESGGSRKIGIGKKISK